MTYYALYYPKAHHMDEPDTQQQPIMLFNSETFSRSYADDWRRVNCATAILVPVEVSVDPYHAIGWSVIDGLLNAEASKR